MREWASARIFGDRASSGWNERSSWAVALLTGWARGGLCIGGICTV